MHLASALAALSCLAYAAARATKFLLPSALPMRIALALVLASALLCTGYGVLGQLSTRQAADIELVFHGDAIAAPRDSTTAGAGEMRVIEDRVIRARATPNALLVFSIGCVLLSLLISRRRTIARIELGWRSALVVPIALSGIAAWRSVPRGYDALWYHLPLAQAFAHNQHLEPPGRDLVFYFPGNMELLARTLIDLRLPAALVQLPFSLALGLLSWALARAIGAGRAAIFAGMLAVSCPMVIFQAGLGYADLVATAALTAGALLAVSALATQGSLAWARALSSGLCLGLALGSKYAALPLIGVGLPMIFLCALARGRPSRALAIAALVSIGVALPAWFWYARNARLTGNPLFPIAVPSLGLRGLFLSSAFNRGKELELVGSRKEWLVYPWIETLSHESGFGAAFATLVPLSLVPLSWRLWRSRRRLPRYTLPFGWGLVYLVAWWVGTPHEVRHLLPLVPLLGAPACLLLRGATRQAHGLRIAVTIAALACCVVVTRLQLFSTTPELSVRPISFSTYYGFPPAVLDALPVGSRIANLASRPYNLALSGTDARLRVIDYAPGYPDAPALDDRHADFVFVRGTPEVIEAARRAGERPSRPWQLRYRAVVPTVRAWSFWGATPTDTVALFERPR